MSESDHKCQTEITIPYSIESDYIISKFHISRIFQQYSNTSEDFFEIKPFTIFISKALYIFHKKYLWHNPFNGLILESDLHKRLLIWVL